MSQSNRISRPSISGMVYKHLKTEVERRQGDYSWLLNMGYGACNDYAVSITQLISAEYSTYVRVETVLRNIRKFKQGRS